ncbi:MAG TPA: ring-cleaving dioxygenase [Gemmatimonadaceae bacterium]|nr:ring-cleaving dioxygenase [Gemmatimonadaceae bacterium]
MITGLHHVTAIAGDAQENVEFYTGVMGMRLVKKSVNQDVPDTYHLFYADAEGHPGTDLTFFPWPQLPPARAGVGLTMEVALAVPANSLDFWGERLEGQGIEVREIETRFGERVLPFTDPHGLPLVLAETADRREFTPWDRSSVSAQFQIRGLHGVRLWERDLAATARFLVSTLGFTPAGAEGGWHRFSLGSAGSGRVLDVQELTSMPRGAWGTGGVHHIAWRVPDDTTQLAVRERVQTAGRRPTPVIDRFWFKSVYFMEPGGALFEVATDGPGFAVDEDPAHLGEYLVLPPWLEPQRSEIEAALPVLTAPATSK